MYQGRKERGRKGGREEKKEKRNDKREEIIGPGSEALRDRLGGGGAVHGRRWSS